MTPIRRPHGSAPRAGIAVVAGILLAGLTSSAEHATQNAGRPAAAIVTATAQLSGVVLTADAAHQPVRRAVVTVSGAELSVSRSTISDDDGRFSIDGLPPGRFVILSTKPAYLPAAYGATRSGQPGTAVTLATGQHVSDVTITMIRGGVISGTIRDPDGAPRQSIRVSAFRDSPAHVFSSAAGVADSDDRGQYRIFGLPLGDYVVVAAFKTSIPFDTGAMSGDDVDAIFSALERGERSGNLAMAKATLTQPPSVTAVPVFFPGVVDAGAATPVRVAAGEDRSGTDITMELAHTARVAGIVMPTPTATTNLKLTMQLDGPDLPIMTGERTLENGRPDSDGRFTFHGVAPGHYLIVAQATDASSALWLPAAWWAQADVQVVGDDVSGITLALKPTLHLSGRIVFDATTLRPLPDASKLSISSPRVGAWRSGDSPSIRMAVPTPVESSGTFTRGGIIPGTYGVAVESIPPGWWLRSAIAGGKDLLDAPLAVSVGDSELPQVVITLSDQHTSLSGTVETPPASASPAYFVVVFPPDRALWLPNARRIRVTRAGTDNKFVFHDLPPGDYRLALVPDFEPDDLLDRTFLDELVSASIKVTLGEGEQKTQDLRIGG